MNRFSECGRLTEMSSEEVLAKIWPLFTPEERGHAICCGQEMDDPSKAKLHETYIGDNGAVRKRFVGNIRFVIGILRSEEERYLKVLAEIEVKGPRELEKRGVSPETFGYLAATRGWPVETTMAQLVSEKYANANFDEARAAQLALSGAGNG